MKIVVLDKENFLSDLPLNGLSCEWQEYENTSPDQVLQHLEGADIALTYRVKLDRNALEQLSNLKMISTNSTGYETIDVAACKDLGIQVCNVQDWCTNSVVEHILSFIFSLNRHQLAYHQAIRHKDWVAEKVTNHALWHPVNKEIAGASIGIVGYGRLGKHLEETVLKLGMKPQIAERKGQSKLRENYTAFEEIMKESDFIVLLAPLTKETYHLISSAELELMKPSAFLINCGRGGLVDEAALLKALEEKRIAGAALDVLEEEPPQANNPMLNYTGNNLLLSPHIAFASQQSIARNSEMILENVRQFLNGTPINVVG